VPITYNARYERRFYSVSVLERLPITAIAELVNGHMTMSVGAPGVLFYAPAQDVFIKRGILSFRVLF
jgi:hypothetical protein